MARASRHDPGSGVDQELGRFPAEIPGGRRRHGAGIEREEVSPGRQNIGAPARRCARGAGRDETVRPGRAEARSFRRSPQADSRAQMRAMSSRTARDATIPGPQRPLPRSVCAPVTPAVRPCRHGAPDAAGFQHRRPWPRPGRPSRNPADRTPAKSTASARISELAAFALRAASAQRDQKIGRKPPSGVAEDMQAVADLHFLQIAEIVVELRESRLRLVIPADAASTSSPWRRSDPEFVAQTTTGADRRPPPRNIRRPALRDLQRTIAFGAGQRRRQMIDDDGGGAALGLVPSPGSLTMNG